MAGSRFVLPSQQPIQSTGLPYPGAQLFFYVSGTTTSANTYQDAALAVPNSNPIVLDSAGDAGNVFLDTSITYKVVLKDQNLNLVWTFDPVYPFASGNVQGLAFAGTTTGSANAQNLSNLPAPYNGQTISFIAGFTNTSSLALNTGAGQVSVYQQGSAGPQLLLGKEVQVGNLYFASYNTSLSSNVGGWQLIGAVAGPGLGAGTNMYPFYQSQSPLQAYAALKGFIPPPTGRLTLTSGVPVLTSPVIAAASVIYTPYIGNQIPYWNVASGVWTVLAFAELTCLLSDSTQSPAAAAAASIYDLFIWNNNGVATLSRGPAWSGNARVLSLAYATGVLTNGTAITNGPGINKGVYVGTIATDAGAATVTFNPLPAGAAGGPVGGAWVGLWNYFNRLPVSAVASDTTASWDYSSATWRSADASANNRVTFVTGAAEDAFTANYLDTVFAHGGTNTGVIAVGLDSTTVPNVQAFVATSSAAGATNSVSAPLISAPVLGKHFVQALESTGTGTATYSGGATQMQISAQLRF